MNKSKVMALWTSEHAPQSIDEVLQSHSRELLRQISEGRLNAVLHGPKGAGKSAAVRALVNDSYGDDSNLFVLNAADFFGMTKSEISEDPRFKGFITSKRARNSSKADLINHVLKEIASHPTVGDTQKVLLIDNAEDMRRDFQQALRRVMERYSDTCQFVLTTRTLSSIIPAIRSRCFPVPFESPPDDAIARRLKEIADAENVEYDDGGIEYIVEASEGNLREAILLLESVAEKGFVDMNTAYEVLDTVGDDEVPEMVEKAYEGEFDDAVDTLDDLMIDEGYSGDDLLRSIVEESRGYDDAKAAHLVKIIGDVEADMVEASNERIHLERLLSALG
ncbi:MAG: AAA family ATPase [Halobacteria archaeon]|nr:AAA family ATPase [Halobacteria archaeon]